jgi:hypothetical protein
MSHMCRLYNELGRGDQTSVGPAAWPTVVTTYLKYQREFSFIFLATSHDSLTKGLLGQGARGEAACSCPERAWHSAIAKLQISDVLWLVGEKVILQSPLLGSKRWLLLLVKDLNAVLITELKYYLEDVRYQNNLNWLIGTNVRRFFVLVNVSKLYELRTKIWDCFYIGMEYVERNVLHMSLNIVSISLSHFLREESCN